MKTHEELSLAFAELQKCELKRLKRHELLCKLTYNSGQHISRSVIILKKSKVKSSVQVTVHKRLKQSSKKFTEGKLRVEKEEYKIKVPGKLNIHKRIKGKNGKNTSRSVLKEHEHFHS